MSTKKENTNSTAKCLSCKKKSIIMLNCMCNQQFCIKCRAPEVHNCSFDYFKYSKDQLEKLNPLVIAKKVDKI